MKRKGEKSLSTVVTFIILLVVAGVVISLVLNTLRTEDIDSRKDKKRVIETQCTTACNRISPDLSTEATRDSVIDYCRKTFSYETGQVESDVVYQSPLGINSFCKDAAHCFNFKSFECEVNEQVIDAEMCHNVMCKRFKSLGLNQSIAEEKIEINMDAGDCNLVKGSRAGGTTIELETWWQKYFQDANCSRYY